MFMISKGVEITVTMLSIVVVILLGVMFYFLIKYNSKKYHDENDNISNDTVPKALLERSISRYIKKVGKFGEFTLINVDIDNFTSLIDTFGEDMCKNFLTEIASRFKKRFPYRTLISNYKEDEFVIFIKDNLTYEQVVKICGLLLSDVKQKLYISTDESISLTASIGICMYPSCGRTVNELIKNILLATYISKREGGNKYTMYYRTLSIDESQNYQFFLEIKKAIRNKEFVLYYQPIVNLNTKNLYGFEALMRWNHPEQGVLPPAKFLDIIDKSGDIYWVGKWGLEILCEKYNELSPIVGDDFHMSLNLSAKQLTYDNMAEELILVAKKAGVLTSNIVFEVSGYAMFEKMENVKNNILKLRDAGFLIAVDGFELDYSTIAKIQKEPIDMIKIARKFFDDSEEVSANNPIESNPDKRKASEEMSRELKDKFASMLIESASISQRVVVLEGVETKEMEDKAISLKASYGQGYYYSKPIAEEELNEFIRLRKWDNQSIANIKPEDASSEDIKENTTINSVDNASDEDSENKKEDANSSIDKTTIEDVKEEINSNEDDTKDEGANSLDDLEDDNIENDLEDSEED